MLFVHRNAAAILLAAVATGVVVASRAVAHDSAVEQARTELREQAGSTVTVRDLQLTNDQMTANVEGVLAEPAPSWNVQEYTPGGIALRFARVVRYRDDKTAEQADTVESVKALFGTPPT